MSEESERNLVLVAYVLHLVGSVAGVTSLIGLILNYVRRDYYGEPFDSHHRWMIRSFWWALLWILIGVVSSVILIGWPIMALAWLWYVYRHIRGLVDLLNGQRMPI